MSDRLDRIVTRSGDDGSTGLADGRRVPKHDPRIEALGAVDELNSFVGLLAGKTQKVATIEEINEAAAQGWAGKQ